MATTDIGGRDAGRLDRWRAGWRVSLRMARRDVRRHRGRSLLVVILVGLPVLLLTAGTTLWFTDDVDATERLPFQLGTSQGYLLPPQPVQVQQLVDPSEWGDPTTGEPPPSRQVPGLAKGTEGTALARLLGARVHEVSTAPASFRVGSHFLSGYALGTTPAPEVLGSRVSLTSGRWPTRPDEAVVTPQGVELGLPTSGTVGLRIVGPDGEGTEKVVTVVGTGRGYDVQSASSVHPVELVTTSVESEYANRQWLVVRDRPISWGEVERLNTYGIGVFSRYVAEHPETMTRRGGGTQPSDVALLTALATVGLITLTTLLAGPAFAVSAARQRHTLALAASNGAPRQQLRRAVLGQALVLGVLSAVVGALAGVGGGVGAVVVTRWLRPDLLWGPLQVDWGSVGLVALAAVTSSVVAALVPSRGLGRLDVVSVLRGQSVSPRLRRRVPLVGVVLVVAGSLLITWAATRRPTQEFLLFAGGSLAVVVGSLFLVPLTLSLGSRLAQPASLPVRMAARQAGRQRGRATPTVAAIMAGASALTVVCIGLQADDARAGAQYSPTVRTGQAQVTWGMSGSRIDELAEVISSTDASVHPLVLRSTSGAGPDTAGADVAVVAQRPGCPLAATLPQPVGGDVSTPPDARCQTVATFGRDVPGASLVVASLDQLSPFLSLTPDQRQALDRGAVAVVDPEAVRDLPLPSTTPALLRDVDRVRPVVLDETGDVATFARWTVRSDANGNLVTPAPTAVTTLRVPVVHLSMDQWTRIVRLYDVPGAIMTTSTAVRLGIRTGPAGVLARADAGISRDLEGRLNDAVRAVQSDAEFVVERGHQRDDALALAVVFGVICLVMLVATLIATALGQAENAPLLGTLAAVGATRRTRRALAGAQASYLALLGAVLGLLVGLPPGLGLAHVLLTRTLESGETVAVAPLEMPWLQILLPVLLVPVVAGALAWVSIRTAPVVVRRTT